MSDLVNHPKPFSVGIIILSPSQWGIWWSRVGINTIWLFIGRILTQAQLAGFTILVARSLGATGFGQYSLITSAIFILNIWTTFGTDTLLIRDLARNPDDKNVIGAALLLQLTLSIALIFLVLIAPLDWLNPSWETQTTLRIYSLSLLPLSFFSVFTAALRAWERMDLYLMMNGIAAGIQLVTGWVVLESHPDLFWLARVLLVVQVCTALIAGWFCYKFIPGFSFGKDYQLKQIFDILQKAWPLALIAALGVFYQRLGILSLSTISGSTPTGWFSAASRVVETLKIGHIAVLGAALPAVSRLSNLPTRMSDSRRLIKTAFWGLILVACLEVAGVEIYAARIVGILFGDEYTPAIHLLRTMVWQLLPYTLTSVLSLRLIANRRERKLFAATLIGTLVNLGIYPWLIVQRGATGASLAIVLGECALAICLVLFRGDLWEKLK